MILYVVTDIPEVVLAAERIKKIYAAIPEINIPIKIISMFEHIIEPVEFFELRVSKIMVKYEFKLISSGGDIIDVKTARAPYTEYSSESPFQISTISNILVYRMLSMIYNNQKRLFKDDVSSQLLLTRYANALCDDEIKTNTSGWNEAYRNIPFEKEDQIEVTKPTVVNSLEAKQLLRMHNKTNGDSGETHVFTKHDHMIMKWCKDLAGMSYCERSQMGAIIAIDEKTFITGYNGTLEGFENKCDEMALVCNVCNVAVDPNDYIEGEKHCKKGWVEKRPKSTLNVIHAETNALFHANVNGISVVGKTMYMTTSPCVTCANNIVKAKIGMIIYENEHDDLRGLETLRKAGVKVVKYTDQSSTNENCQ